MIDLNEDCLNRAYYPTDEKTEMNIPDEEANAGQTIKIANFAEELKDRANYNGMDICFVLDATGSMSSYIAGSKECLKTIMNDAKKSLTQLNAEEDSLKFAIVAYRDHPPQDVSFVTSICDFTSAAESEAFLNGISASGGGDTAEAVIDGLYDAMNKLAWRDLSEKFLFLVADAPPHGKTFGNNSDGFPDGCPCGYSEKDILPQMREKKVDFTIIKLSQDIEKMISIYSQYINIDVFNPKRGGNQSNAAEEMKSCVTTKVCTNLSLY